jgi:hypothetical protein
MRGRYARMRSTSGRLRLPNAGTLTVRCPGELHLRTLHSRTPRPLVGVIWNTVPVINRSICCVCPEFYVDGTTIPDVDFDVGPSWSGLMPISSNKNETRKVTFLAKHLRERGLTLLAVVFLVFPTRPARQFGRPHILVRSVAGPNTLKCSFNLTLGQMAARDVRRWKVYCKKTGWVQHLMQSYHIFNSWFTAVPMGCGTSKASTKRVQLDQPI